MQVWTTVPDTVVNANGFNMITCPTELPGSNTLNSCSSAGYCCGFLDSGSSPTTQVCLVHSLLPRWLFFYIA